MSLEDAINRLAVATENNAAVREIIRQRDEALLKVESLARSLKWTENMKDSYYKSYQEQSRKNIAMRGVITRMKRKGASHGSE